MPLERTERIGRCGNRQAVTHLRPTVAGVNLLLIYYVTVSSKFLIDILPESHFIVHIAKRICPPHPQTGYIKCTLNGSA